MLAAQVALKVTGAARGKALGFRFFDLLLWSRLVEWGREFTRVRGYVLQNAGEAAGAVPYRPRGRRFPSFHEIASSLRSSQ